MKKQPKVDVIVKYFYPVAAGIETNIMETYSVLAKKGWDITIHTSVDTLIEKNCLAKTETIRGLKIKRYQWSKLGFWPKIKWQKTNMVCLHNFNIMPHLLIMAYCYWLKILAKKNFGLFLTPHGGFNPEWSVFPKNAVWFKRSYHFTLGAFMINLIVDGVRAVSNWERLEMLKKGIKAPKAVVISNGIEDEAYLTVEKLASTQIKKQVKSYGKYLIQIGRVYPIKNYETTIKAMTKLPKDIHYVIAGPLDYVMGKATYKEQLDQLIEKLGLTGRVHFIGVVRGIDKYYLIKKAQMMVHMALWESFCNVVHEGLSQGLVCLVANNTALPLLIKDGFNGYCIETLDSNGLAKKINYVLSHQRDRFIREMKVRNRELGLEDSWQKTALKMGQFYEQRSPNQTLNIGYSYDQIGERLV